MTGRDGTLDYDVVVVGSGFGGSVAALRLVEKGYRVGVVEAGRRFDESTFPKTSWQVRRFLWAPRLGCYGIQRISLLRNVVALSGAGVGGGSLVYANTLYEPAPEFFDDPQWARLADWRDELAPYYARARRMLGVTPNPVLTPADLAMRRVAEELGVADTFGPTPVGVFFGAPGVEVPDPYFGGAGPARRGCLHCGSCMTGCRHGAKNMLTKNYLFLAEQAGAQVLPLTTVTALAPRRGGGWSLTVQRSDRWVRRERCELTAEQVVLAAGALGTQRLLHRMRDAGRLPHLSPRLGELTRTNSEAILGARSRRRDVDFSQGVAITSSFHPDAHTHVEPVRYGRGSNLMGLLQTLLTDPDPRRPRPLVWLREARRHPRTLLRTLWLRHWSEQTVIALVMQSLDNSLTAYGRRGRFGRWRLTTRQGHGAPNPVSIPVATDVARRLAQAIDGDPGGSWGEVADIPMTAHIIGGCPIGADPASGVVDPWHRVFGYPGLHVVDGSAVPANLGVNPSLTITALAERALACWPNRGEPDPRPPLGAPYARVPAVPPQHPAVPARSPAAVEVAS